MFRRRSSVHLLPAADLRPRRAPPGRVRGADDAGGSDDAARRRTAPVERRRRDFGPVAADVQRGPRGVAVPAARPPRGPAPRTAARGGVPGARRL